MKGCKDAGKQRSRDVRMQKSGDAGMHGSRDEKNKKEGRKVRR